MEFGIFSNSRRPTRTVGDAWEEDIFEIVVADRLGFRVAWISEHQSPAELIICKAAGQTRQIRLGSAVRPLAYYHPLQVAIEANACDQLTAGRYQLGVGFGFYAAQMEQRGLDFSKTRDMMHASIDLIQKLWTSKEPVDYDGPFWKGKAMVVKPDTVQKPHPPIGIACAKTPGSAELAGRLGLLPLTGDFIPLERLKMFGDAYVAGARAAGRKPSRNGLHATRVIYVAESTRKRATTCATYITRRSAGRSPTPRITRSSAFPRAAPSPTSISTTWSTPPTFSSARPTPSRGASSSSMTPPAASAR